MFFIYMEIFTYTYLHTTETPRFANRYQIIHQPNQTHAMLLDPNAPASELTIRAEIALRMVQANAAMAGSKGEYALTRSILEHSLRATDLFLKLINYDPALDQDTEEETFEFAMQYYMQD